MSDLYKSRNKHNNGVFNEKNEKLLRWMCHARPKVKISAVEFRNRLQSNTMREFLQNKNYYSLVI